MEKERSTVFGRGRILPPLASFSGFSSIGNSFGARGESSRSVAPVLMPAMPELGRIEQAISFGFGQFISSSYLTQMKDVPQMNAGHRRAQSDSLGLPNKVIFGSGTRSTGTSDGSALSEENAIENEEDLIAMYMDMDKLSSSSGFYGLEGGPESVQATPQAPSSNENLRDSPSEKPIVRHQQSLSLDGFTSAKPELPISGPEWTMTADTRKALSAARLAEIALVDPKRAKRILGNRQSAARSKERKIRYVSEIEQKAKKLETEVATLSVQFEMIKMENTSLKSESNELKVRLQSVEQKLQMQEAITDALKDEIEHLRETGRMVNPNGGQMTNNGASFGSDQQVYLYDDNMMQALITAHQLQQLQICPPLHPNQVQHRPPNVMRNMGPDFNGSPIN